MCIGSPLKKIGFQKKKGTSPHLINIDNISVNQGISVLTVSQKLHVTVK